MSDTSTTMSDEQKREIAIDANTLYELYNLIGRGHVDEINWCCAYMSGNLSKLIERIEEREHEHID